MILIRKLRKRFSILSIIKGLFVLFFSIFDYFPDLFNLLFSIFRLPRFQMLIFDHLVIFEFRRFHIVVLVYQCINPLKLFMVRYFEDVSVFLILYEKGFKEIWMYLIIKCLHGLLTFSLVLWAVLWMSDALVSLSQERI